jgi:hypothetical protein
VCWALNAKTLLHEQSGRRLPAEILGAVLDIQTLNCGAACWVLNIPTHSYP